MALKLMGGIYLCFLGYKIWITANLALEPKVKNNKNNSYLKSFFLGLFTQLSNPKTAIVFSSIFMTFWPMEIPKHSNILLCVLVFIIDTGWYVIASVLLTTPKPYKFYVRFKKYINRIAGGVIGLMGVKLAFNQ